MDSLLAQIEYQSADAPNDALFRLWRAVFSLAHVDGELASQERALIEQAMDIFSFNDEQRAEIEADMGAAGNVLGFFRDIELPLYRSQFFRLARIMIWSDGFLHEDELAMIEAIKEDLGDEAAEYEADLRWITRKPDLPMGESAVSPEEETMKHVIVQMISFYEQIEV